MWGFLAADVVRYGCHFLFGARSDLPGYLRWLHATGRGMAGDFGPPPRSWRLADERSAAPAPGIVPRRAGSNL